MRSVSEETREFLAQVAWLQFTYPTIKQRAAKIEKAIKKLEAKRPNKKKE